MRTILNIVECVVFMMMLALVCSCARSLRKGEPNIEGVVTRLYKAADFDRVHDVATASGDNLRFLRVEADLAAVFVFKVDSKFIEIRGRPGQNLSSEQGTAPFRVITASAERQRVRIEYLAYSLYRTD